MLLGLLRHIVLGVALLDDPGVRLVSNLGQEQRFAGGQAVGLRQAGGELLDFISACVWPCFSPADIGAGCPSSFVVFGEINSRRGVGWAIVPCN